jgi:oligoendopeptidase F
MVASLPGDTAPFMSWTWSDIEPHARELQTHTISTSSVDDWLCGWSWIAERVDEMARRLEVATTRDTNDEKVKGRYHWFLDEISPKWREAEQRLKEKLLDSGLKPSGFEMQLRKIRTEASLYREDNLPLLAEERKLEEEYQQIQGAQTVEWRGAEIPVSLLRPFFAEQDRALREEAWRLASGRFLADREAIGAIWRRALGLRLSIASNAGEPNYRSYRWKELKRFDYTPKDCMLFHRAVEERVVPAVARSHEWRRMQLGLETLRPWDLEVDPLGRPPLRPFESTDELIGGLSSMFRRVDRELGSYFDCMASEGLLDLDSRVHKAQTGYCLPFNAARLPFIFLNSAGTHDDVMGMLHEGGHSFHVFEMGHLPYVRQRDIETLGIEFGEVGSIAMEFLAMPYLARDEGGFYTTAEAARARIETLEWDLTGWCRVAVIDAFQHWVYLHPDQAADPSRCDDEYAALHQRYLPTIDYSGLEDAMRSGWREVPHIFGTPFYFIEYGLSQLGAAQIWAGALRDQSEAVARYRHALALGDTLPIPELFAEAGAGLAFDAETLGQSVDLMVDTIDHLRSDAAVT